MCWIGLGPRVAAWWERNGEGGTAPSRRSLAERSVEKARSLLRLEALSHIARYLPPYLTCPPSPPPPNQTGFLSSLLRSGCVLSSIALHTPSLRFATIPRAIVGGPRVPTVHPPIPPCTTLRRTRRHQAPDDIQLIHAVRNSYRPFNVEQRQVRLEHFAQSAGGTAARAPLCSVRACEAVLVRHVE